MKKHIYSFAILVFLFPLYVHSEEIVYLSIDAADVEFGVQDGDINASKIKCFFSRFKRDNPSTFVIFTDCLN